MKKVTVTGYVNAAKRKPVAKRKTAITKNSPSQSTGKKPTKRLVKRRVANVTKGAYPNPRVYKVYQVYRSKRLCVASCTTRSAAQGVASGLNYIAKPGVSFVVE